MAAVVEIAFTLAADIASIDADAKQSLARAMRAALACRLPECILELRFRAGSVDVGAVLTMPEAAGGGGNEATLAAVTAAASSITESAAAMGNVLGVDVTGVAAPIVREAATVPLVVAPPPPASEAERSPAPSPPPSGSTTPAAGVLLGAIAAVLLAVVLCGLVALRRRAVLRGAPSATPKRKGEELVELEELVEIATDGHQRPEAPRRLSSAQKLAKSLSEERGRLSLSHKRIDVEVRVTKSSPREDSALAEPGGAVQTI